eukprot:m.30200 g.30200  ORF g.30200 m.30200 type:complete len:50 (+) comp16230_c0_seq1:946-1095(+)
MATTKDQGATLRRKQTTYYRDFDRPTCDHGSAYRVVSTPTNQQLYCTHI